MLEQWASGGIKPDIEKIKTEPKFFRMKIGNFRVIYYPLTSERVVLLLIRDRKKSYLGLGNLDTRLATALRKLNLGGR